MKTFSSPLSKWYLTQRFGENPDFYEQYNQLGHCGIDFRTKFIDSPLGHRIVYPVMDGIVMEIGDQGNKGYGKFVRLAHDIDYKEQTVYAHLESHSVSIGESVKGGITSLGISDNTGGSTGSHLHFGYRPDGYKNDGWCGYVDPLPYFKLMNKRILIKNKTNNLELNTILDSVKEWYKERNEEIIFCYTEGALGYWAEADIVETEGEHASGGGPKENANPYWIYFKLGDLGGGKYGKSLKDILIHEIMHCYYFDEGLGNIHDYKTKEYPRGLTGSQANEYNWQFYLSLLNNNMKDEMTKEEINKLCLLTFKRPMDKEMESYVGHSFDFVADEWLKSKEHEIFTPLYNAGKDIENFGK